MRLQSIRAYRTFSISASLIIVDKGSNTYFLTPLSTLTSTPPMIGGTFVAFGGTTDGVAMSVNLRGRHRSQAQALAGVTVLLSLN